MNTFPSMYGLRTRERGATLVVVLMILLVITVLGIGAAKISLLGERSARFDRDYQVAWQAAEAALMDAEFDIRGPDGTRTALFTHTERRSFEPGCSSAATTQGLCLANETGKPVWYLDGLSSDTDATGRTVQFGTFTGHSFDAGGGVGIKPAKAPRYIIEALDDPTPGGNRRLAPGARRTLYRVTAMGFGPREEIQAVVQMVFRKE